MKREDGKDGSTTFYRDDGSVFFKRYKDGRAELHWEVVKIDKDSKLEDYSYDLDVLRKKGLIGTKVFTGKVNPIEKGKDFEMSMLSGIEGLGICYRKGEELSFETPDTVGGRRDGEWYKCSLTGALLECGKEGRGSLEFDSNGKIVRANKFDKAKSYQIDFRPDGTVKNIYDYDRGDNTECVLYKEDGKNVDHYTSESYMRYREGVSAEQLKSEGKEVFVVGSGGYYITDNYKDEDIAKQVGKYFIHKAMKDTARKVRENRNAKMEDPEWVATAKKKVQKKVIAKNSKKVRTTVKSYSKEER